MSFLLRRGSADPNLRMSTDKSSRQSTNEMYSFGTDWSRGRFFGQVEVSTSINDTDTPAFDTTLNFINPNVATNSSNENGTPFEYDLRGRWHLTSQTVCMARRRQSSYLIPPTICCVT